MDMIRVDELFVWIILFSDQISASTPRTSIDEEQRAAEIAAKKNRLKQKFVKGARSIAVFSLKLKERRAKEAERVAREKAEEEAEEQVRQSRLPSTSSH
jgi:anoctamin-8